MSIIVILAVVGFLALIGLAEAGVFDRLKESTGVNWFGSAPSGEYTDVMKKKYQGSVAIMVILELLLIFGASSVSKKFTTVGTFYASMVLVFLLTWATENINKVSFPFGLFDGTLPKGNYVLKFFMSIPLALFFVLAGNLSGVFSSLPALTMKGSAGLSFLMVGWIAPTVESLFFRGVITPTLAEKSGIVPSLILTSTAFSLFHYFIPTGVDFSFIIFAFLFSMVSSSISLHERSVWTSSWLHIFYNIVTLLIV